MVDFTAMTQKPTPIRTFRIPDDLYNEALAKSKEQGESLTSVVVAALERYVKQHRKEQQ